MGLKGKAQHTDAFTGHGAEQAVHHQAGDAVLLPGVELHHLLPVIGHLLHIGAGGFAEGGDAVDRADQLGAAVETWWLMLFKEGIRSQPTG